MSSRTARSSSTLQAARAAVTERARRSGAATRKGPARRSAAGTPSRAKPGHAQKGPGKQPSVAKKGAPSTTGGKAPRSTSVVLRRIRPLSVLRVSVLFYLGLCLALFVASVLLWAGANTIGLVGNIEGFMDEVGFTDFRLRPGPLLLTSALVGFVMVIAGSFANYLMAVLYNLIADVVGGIKVVLTEDREIPEK